MLTLIKEILTWWNHQTFGTRLNTIFFGKLDFQDTLELGTSLQEVELFQQILKGT